ncbi:MAG: triose-phosphate isomerase [Candidatus Uhrbacteria bacterium]|nr:triose-phosphate isomerase [Candidatus Uhrbacteria bacterium]
MRKIIIANWKMHYGPMKAGAWMRVFRRERLPKDIDIGIAIPHVSLAAARSSIGRASVPLVGAQNVFWQNEGAFTGETSPAMLKEFEVAFCLVGHSERRFFLGETDEMVAKKASALQKTGIQPIICVGENATEHKKGEALKVVKRQLLSAVKGLKGDGETAPLIAYEPIWAISTGKQASPCSPHDAKNMHEWIREILEKKFGKAGKNIRILYGGSVDPHNVADYLSTSHIDGALVGNASLDPQAFGLLCRSAVTA